MASAKPAPRSPSAKGSPPVGGAARRLAGKRGAPARHAKVAKKDGKPEVEPARQRDRRALSHVGGRIELVGGSETERAALTAALAVNPDETSTQAHVHGFHSYPARLHPRTARKLIEALSRPGERVLDPFCGSGTVLVEARLLGRSALGVDVNPLAIELSELKANGPGALWAKRLPGVADKVLQHAEERRYTKAGATKRYPDIDVKLFAPHVLLELDSLKDGILHVENEAIGRALMLVLSAVLTKVSVRGGDTGRIEGPKRIPTGSTLRLFHKKAEELAHRLAAAAELLPPRAPAARVIHGDARDLTAVDDGIVDLAVSSPPYAGVYDYVVHHRDRLRWLELPEDRFERFEIGARRHTRGVGFAPALGRFETELGDSLAELGRVLAPRGAAVIIIADSVLANRAIYAEELVARLATRAGLEVTAVASQKRPHVHAPTQDAFVERPRREHAILLRRAKRGAKI